jgi:hypothetical protein
MITETQNLNKNRIQPLNEYVQIDTFIKENKEAKSNEIKPKNKS